MKGRYIALTLVLCTVMTVRPVSAQNNLQERQKQVQEQLSKLDHDVVDTVTQMNDLKEKISQNEENIKNASEGISSATASADKQKQQMKARMKATYENGSTTTAMTALAGSKNLADFVSRVEYTSQVYDHDRQLLGAYEATTKELQDLKEGLNRSQKDLTEEQSALQSKKAQLDTLAQNKQKEGQEISGQIAEVDRLMKEQAQIKEEALKSNTPVPTPAPTPAPKTKTQQNRSKNTRPESTQKDQNKNTRREDTHQKDTRQNQSKQKATPSANGQAIVNYAKQFVGNPYVWGGTSLTNGADCSGFVGQVMAHFGLLDQKMANYHGYVSGAFASLGKPVSENDLQPGDIIVYSGHVAIYAGDGKIVEALNPKAGIVYGRRYNSQPIIAMRRL